MHRLEDLYRIKAEAVVISKSEVLELLNKIVLRIADEIDFLKKIKSNIEKDEIPDVTLREHIKTMASIYLTTEENLKFSNIFDIYCNTLRK